MSFSADRGSVIASCNNRDQWLICHLLVSQRHSAAYQLQSLDHAHRHHDSSNPPPLRLTSRKPLWRESEPVDINSQWRESWKSASVVNAHLVDDPTIRQPGFALSLDNSGLSWTVSAPDKVTAVPVRRNGNFQTPISVPAVRPKGCHTLSNPAHRQDYTVACLNYTLQTMPGWPVMAPNAYDNNNNRPHWLSLDSRQLQTWRLLSSQRRWLHRGSPRPPVFSSDQTRFETSRADSAPKLPPEQANIQSRASSCTSFKH